MRNSIKQYAKDAKKRMKCGFWEEYRDRTRDIRETAERESKNPDPQLTQLRQLTVKRIYEYDRYASDEEFYQRVKVILESEEVIKNPIIMLADKDKLATLDGAQVEAYLLGISRRFDEMRLRYEREKNI